MPLVSEEKQTKLGKYIAELKALNETVLGPSLIDHAYKIDIVNKSLTIEFKQKFDIEIEFGSRFGGFNRARYHSWCVCMESEE